ncbi:hypothetical protein BCR37DRAFT_383446 [Protomyces lactucae-debilis]|uniref:Uncharacterized protein n=1 Tax=Protomyces lactucae-debilis TaxID=2754530 RepID=A0A1Y2EXM9_PROLT|nr:uncharacterized protein BCR37DRAFT_383446 [Protomyces lactucae-debilis]ORY76353.1 hypothetical protein BCR37DRAFT_383446 [Protomyces lactucae-debilis]
MRSKHWLTRCSVKQTRALMFPGQVRPIFDVIRLTSGQKSSKDRSASSSRKQANKARKSAKKAKKAAARL